MLIYDFDGVLMDSVREVAVTAYNMVKGTIATRLNQIPNHALKSFIKNRFHIQPIGDAPVLMNWCLESAGAEPLRLMSEKEYEEILKRVDEPLTRRTTSFFETRSRFKAKDKNAWLSLNRPVQPVWHMLAQKYETGPVILTHKNREATLTLCRHYGLEITDRNIYSGDNGTTKIENMTRIMQRFKKSSYSFIDDSVKNLSDIDTYFNKQEKPFSLILATWGYIGPDDVNRAERLGYRPLAIGEFEDILTPK